MNRLCFGISQPTRLHLQQKSWGSGLCRASRSRTAKNAYCSPGKRRAHVMMAPQGEVNELLGSEDFLQRIRGINRIDELDAATKKVSSLIPLATGDSNQQVRYAAISRLSNLDVSGISKDDKDEVLAAARYVLVNDKESSCQSGAADLIAGMKLCDGFDDLVDAFNQTSDWMLKFSIAAGLGEMGDPKAYDFLTSILENESGSDALLMTAALGSLGELGDQRAVPVIERFLDSEDSSVRERASIAHGMLVDEKGAT